MSNRKRISILLASLFAAAVVLAVIWFLIPDNPSGSEIEDSRKQEVEPSKNAAGPEAASGDNVSRSNEKSGGQDDYPLVMRLLKSYQKRQIFGSFRIKSILAHDTDPGSSRATIEDMNTGSSRTYAVNDILPDDSRLAGIERNYIVLEKSGVRKRIYFNSSADKNLLGSRSAGFRKLSNNEFDMNPYRMFRGDAARALDFTMKVHNRDGDMDGIQVSDLENNTLFRTLGLQEGDVLLEVNGNPVDSLLNSVKACINAYYSDDVQLKILRNDKKIDLTYHLFWEGQGSWTPMEVLNSKAVSSLFDSDIASHLF